MYRITLKPLQPFFFGGAHSFTQQKGYDRYYARSELFPSQTQILGMLRKTIMFNEDVLKSYPRGDFVPEKKKEKAKKLVGEKWQIDKKTPNLGKIDKISPIFLFDDNNFYMKAPLDFGLDILEKGEGKAYYNGKLKKSYQIIDKTTSKPFNAKQELYDGFLCDNGRSLDTSSIYLPVEQVGNKKLYGGGTSEDAFYKKRSYLFKDDLFKFAFFVHLKEGLELIPQSIITLGADRSKFMLSMQEVGSDTEVSFGSSIRRSSLSKLVLLSDALFTKEMIEKCAFSLAYKKPFKYNKGKGKYFQKSNQYHMISAGSVFYGESETVSSLYIELNKNKNLTAIGFNKAIIIEGENNA